MHGSHSTEAQPKTPNLATLKLKALHYFPRPPPIALPSRSLSVNSLPPTSIGVSNIGGGPVAVAAAGMAVSVSAADSQDNASSITRRH